jgi:diacylglycerol diphosphate phosphatase/phosphatidate phosphatase
MSPTNNPPQPTMPPPNPPQSSNRTEPDIEARTSNEPRQRRSALIPGFNDPPPFRVFIRHNWYDIATQLLCLLAAFLLYKFCPPILPRYFPFYPGIEKTAWGMKHSRPYLDEYISTNTSAIVSFAVPAIVMGGIALWGTRRFEDGNAAVSHILLLRTLRN